MGLGNYAPDAVISETSGRNSVAVMSCNRFCKRLALSLEEASDRMAMVRAPKESRWDNGIQATDLRAGFPG